MDHLVVIIGDILEVVGLFIMIICYVSLYRLRLPDVYGSINFYHIFILLLLWKYILC